jgi:hypothetical protein
MPPPAGSAALVLLRQTRELLSSQSLDSRGGSAANASDNLIATVNGQGGIALGSSPSQAAISKSIFDIDAVSVTKLKMDLIERTGRALSVREDDYASRDDFVTAMREAVAKMRAQPHGDLAVLALEKKLGLDKLGISIDDVINGVKDDEGNGKLNRALEAQVKGQDRGTGLDVQDGDPLDVAMIRVDDIGRYDIAIS